MKEGEPEAFDNLTQTVRAILDTGGVVNDSRSGSLTEDDEKDLLDAFVSCFKGSDDHPPVDRWRNRFRIARKADDYLRAHLNRSVTAAELCRELKVGRRLLYYAMTDVYQCSPVSYHRRLRLQSARIDLRDRSKHLSVSEAARRWGFNNMGHFSRYYREMFAELPSVTA
jgi:AraC-like DNA-binding protein